MQLKSTILFLTILFHLLFFPFCTNAKTFQENTLTKAIQLFDKEKYAEAEPLFKKLLDDRPDDFMVNYFYGACRTENGHYSDQDLSYLFKASKEVNPLNIDYYFAIQHHANNKWEEALAYYKMYKALASANEQEKVGLLLKMEQCKNHINPFKSSDVEDSKEDTNVTVVGETGSDANDEITGQQADKLLILPSIESDSAKTKTEDSSAQESEESKISELNDSTIQNINPKQGSLTIEQQGSSLTEAEYVKPAEEKINFNINSEITYNAVSNFKTEEGKINFEEATSKENELSKILIRTEILREKYKNSQSHAERDSLGQLILVLEGDAYDMKNIVTHLFINAKTVENGYWHNVSPEEKENFIKDLNLAEQQENKRLTDETQAVSESLDVIIPPILIENEEVKSSASKENPSGIIYKIQIGAYSRGIPNSLKPVFSKISVLRKVENYTDENGVVVYTTGNLNSYEDAVVMQGQVKQEGIKDPKIAAYLNGKRITLEQAKEIENK